ncbi:NAD-dependent epimerase/dehydratase family protein [Chromobacterium haemolyticum]|uniref:NAD-dependent epimerase/dehydratase family protein n=1 Tax=Chromobacterium haemolyticum TaxID=394935 RepID=UPI000DEF97EB|nr:NAD(P)-dependent oxidoreductase [Chromobacterium haemolyticum]
MRIFLTGASGFLGSALARYWLAQGHDLWLLVRPSSQLDRLSSLSESVQIVSTTAIEEIAAAVCAATPDVIVHTACSYGRKGETALNVMDTNLRLGAALLQAALDTKHQEFCPITFLNAGTVLGPDVSLYALSKTQFSAWGRTVADHNPNKLRFVDICIQQMYGAGDDRSKFSTHVIEACRHNEPRLALTAGDQLRDFIHIDDVVSAFDCILEKRQGFSTSDSIEVGSGTAVTMRCFVELAKQVAGASTILDFGAVPYRSNEAMRCVANIERLKGLGWEAKVSLVEGLEKIMAAGH